MVKALSDEEKNPGDDNGGMGQFKCFPGPDPFLFLIIT